METGTRLVLILQGCYCRSRGGGVGGDNIYCMSNFRYHDSGRNHESDRRVTLEEYRPVCALAGLLRNSSSK